MKANNGYIFILRPPAGQSEGDEAVIHFRLLADGLGNFTLQTCYIPMRHDWVLASIRVLGAADLGSAEGWEVFRPLKCSDLTTEKLVQW